MATLIRARMLAPAVRELTFDAGPSLTFVPGQWVNLFVRDGAGAGSEPLKRSYSIASPRRADGTFDLAVTRVEGGPMSARLHAASLGDSFEISHAQGFFTLAPPRRNVLLVATGTGVAPFRSMLNDLELRAEAQDEGARFVLLLGARTQGELLYRDEWAALAAAWPAFEFAPTLSQGDDAWAGRRGYVQAHLAEVVAKLGGGEAIDAYACGLQKMVGEVRKALRETLGVPRDRIHHERYD
jgi:ferredoxin-NADP reductase